MKRLIKNNLRTVCAVLGIGTGIYGYNTHKDLCRINVLVTKPNDERFSHYDTMILNAIKDNDIDTLDYYLKDISKYLKWIKFKEYCLGNNYKKKFKINLYTYFLQESAKQNDIDQTLFKYYPQIMTLTFLLPTSIDLENVKGLQELIDTGIKISDLFNINNFITEGDYNDYRQHFINAVVHCKSGIIIDLLFEKDKKLLLEFKNYFTWNYYLYKIFCATMDFDNYDYCANIHSEQFLGLLMDTHTKEQFNEITDRMVELFNSLEEPFKQKFFDELCVTFSYLLNNTLSDTSKIFVDVKHILGLIIKDNPNIKIASALKRDNLNAKLANFLVGFNKNKSKPKVKVDT